MLSQMLRRQLLKLQRAYESPWTCSDDPEAAFHRGKNDSSEGKASLSAPSSQDLQDSGLEAERNSGDAAFKVNIRVTMHLRLLPWILVTLELMEGFGSQNAARGRRQRRMHPNVSQGCQGGCATCSDYNGCLSCKPRLFFVLERIGMKQIGVCLSSCPSGYYGTRYPDINKCTKCKADCDTCFNKNFCTKCKSGFYLHLGKCLENCPEGLEANNHTMECISIVHCEAGEWGPWSPCMKKGKTCGFKRGTETRVREIIQHPSAKGNLCPPTSETRKCTVQRKKCQKGERGKKGRERKRKKLNKEESKEAVPDNKGLESSRDAPEQRENKDKQQQKKRKAQDKQQKSLSVSTVH